MKILPARCMKFIKWFRVHGTHGGNAHWHYEKGQQTPSAWDANGHFGLSTCCETSLRQTRVNTASWLCSEILLQADVFAFLPLSAQICLETHKKTSLAPWVDIWLKQPVHCIVLAVTRQIQVSLANSTHGGKVFNSVGREQMWNTSG